MEKTDSKASPAKRTTIAAGSEPIKIWGRWLIKKLILGRKKTRTEIRVAVFKKMFKDNDGSRPKRVWRRLRWPEDETGINSVKA